ncbi:MAG: MerR family transcriptional regulator [Bryobacterales bacterium]|nr:MerR family transcriptional regulator [Bryobacterales bacterium]
MALGAVARTKQISDKTGHSISPPTEIPDKLMFRIGEVSRIVGVETYVLRYWETEFPQLAPKKSGSGHRMYRRKEVEQLLLIRQLLYERQYTIKGARNYLKELARKRSPHVDPLESGNLHSAVNGEGPAPLTAVASASAGTVANLGSLREELRSILTLLS